MRVGIQIHVTGQKCIPHVWLVLGYAGTGKSHLVRALRAMFHIFGWSDRTLRTTAHQGIAAANIEGQTIVTMFGIRIKLFDHGKSKTSEYDLLMHWEGDRILQSGLQHTR